MTLPRSSKGVTIAVRMVPRLPIDIGRSIARERPPAASRPRPIPPPRRWTPSAPGAIRTPPTSGCGCSRCRRRMPSRRRRRRPRDTRTRAAPPPEPSCVMYSPGRRELLDALVVGVDHPDVALRVDRQAGGLVELCFTVARRPELADEFARCRELGHAAVVGIGDPEISARGDGDAHRRGEFVAVGHADLLDEFPFGARTPRGGSSGVRHPYVPARIDRDAAGFDELAFAETARAELPQVFAG